VLDCSSTGKGLNIIQKEKRRTNRGIEGGKVGRIKVRDATLTGEGGKMGTLGEKEKKIDDEALTLGGPRFGAKGRGQKAEKGGEKI